MQNLIPFQKIDLPFRLQADLFRASPNICLKFEIQDLQSRLLLPEPFSIAGSDIPRADELWSQTCFEMFLQPLHQSFYYEFNFALSPAWNLYKFDGYRNPQPPRQSEDYQLRQMKWDGQFLILDLFSPYPITGFTAGITAVLKENSGAVHYLALDHKSDRPDFHNSESFILTR